jgi:uncharacterized protein (TIGR00266 family)
MSQERMWFVGLNGQQIGPIATSEVIQRIRQGHITQESYVFAQGMASWVSILQVADFNLLFAPAPAAPPVAPPMTSAAPRADVIDYKLFGEEMQFVEITLDPGEGCISEAGAMFYMDSGIATSTVFGDGATRNEGLLDKAFSMGKRALMGESLALTMFTNQANRRQVVAFAAPYPGKIIALDLKALGGTILCERGAFLTAARGVKLDIAFQKKLSVGLFGGEGFILQKLTGDGMAFVHSGGYLVERRLAAGETIKLDTGCLVAIEPSVQHDIQSAGSITSALFGGEGLFLATLTGPGVVWMQSLPFSRLSARVLANAPVTRS